MLSNLFGEDEDQSNNSETGIIFDDLQIKIVEKSFRFDFPERLSAYKDEYKHLFPVNVKSQELLQVPLSLDDLLRTVAQETTWG